jgi:hypothetical protein
MRTRLLLVAAVLTSTLSGCGGDDEKASAPPAVPARSTESQALPVGKSLLQLAQDEEYLSPDGFAPQVRFRIPGAGWVSTHRGADGFDVGQPVPGQDAALVVVAFLSPPEDSAAGALAAIRSAADAAGAAVTGENAVTVTGGQGPLIQSRDQGIALDAVPEGYSTITVADSDDGPLLTVTWVPDGANQAQADPLADALLAQVR